MDTNKSKVKIIRVIRILARGRHAWVEAEVDGKKIKIRKPLTEIPVELIPNGTN